MRLALVLLAVSAAATAQERSTHVQVTLHPGLARTRVNETIRAIQEPVGSIGEDMVVQLHSLHDISFVLFEGRFAFGLCFDDELGEDPFPQDPDLILAADLIDWIETNIAPETWTPPRSVHHREGRLIVRHEPVVQEAIARLLASLRGRGPAYRPLAPADALSVETTIEETPARRDVTSVWLQPHPGGAYEIPWRPGPYEVSIELVASSPIASLEIDPPWPLEVAWSGPHRVTIEGSVPGGGLRLRYR